MINEEVISNGRQALTVWLDYKNSFDSTPYISVDKKFRGSVNN